MSTTAFLNSQIKVLTWYEKQWRTNSLQDEHIFLDNESKRVSFNRTHFFKLWSLLETCFCQLYRQGTVPLQQVYIDYGKSTDLLSLLSDTRLYLPAPNSSVRFFWWLSSVLCILKVFQTFPTFAMITIWNVVCFIFFASTSSLCSKC